MARKLDLKVGQEVVLRHINDRVRYSQNKTIDNIDNWTSSGVVTKIGRKYIEVNMGDKVDILEKFDIEFDYVQKVSAGLSDYKLYLSRQEIIDEVKGEELYYKVRKHFTNWNNNNRFTIDQLNRILSVIREGCNNE